MGEGNNEAAKIPEEGQHDSAGSGAQAAADATEQPADEGQREARETLKAISAAMAERSKQPLSRGGEAATAAATAPVEHAPATAVTGQAGPRNDNQPEFVYHIDAPAAAMPAAPPAQEPTPAPEQAPEAADEQTPVPITTTSAKRANLNLMLLGATAFTLIVGGVGFYLGLQISTQRIVVSGLAPAKDAGLGKGGPLHLSGENRIAEIAADAVPTVVNIHLAPLQSTGNDLPGNQPGSMGGFNFFIGPGFHSEPGHEGFFKRSVGTGVIVRSDGYILTAAHVIKPHSRIVVTLTDTRTFDARLVGKDTFTDLAVLKVDADNLPVARFGSAKAVKPGDWAIAIGSPFGYDHTVTLGIISAIGRSLGDLNNHVDLLQTDAAINPGNSGGPLLNIRGEVIGINAAVRTGAQNIGFAVPVDVVREIANSIMANGSIHRPYLGIFMDDVTPYVAQQYGLKNATGVLITRMASNSPCEKAGMGEGDVIVKVDGKAVSSAKEVRETLRDRKPGDVMEFVFSRKGSQEKREVVIGNYPDDY